MMTLDELIKTRQPLLSDEVNFYLSKLNSAEIKAQFNESHDSEFKKEVISELDSSDLVFDNCYDTPYVSTVKEYLDNL